MEIVSSEVRIALSTFNSAYKSIEDRKLIIDEKRVQMKNLKPAVDDYNRLAQEVKDLTKENDKDRDYISNTIDFYEKHTGGTVELGDLFEKEETN